MKFGLLIFPGAEELDFVGPWEVITSSVMVRHKGEIPEGEAFIIAETAEPVRCAKGMRVVPDYTIDNAPDFDVLLIPGGMGTRPLETNEKVVGWVKSVAPSCAWLTSVCTGSLILGAAGLTKGKRVTTHWGFIEELRKKELSSEVLEDTRYVRDGNVVTSAGVSAGIDMTLWLIGQIWDEKHARTVQHYIEYSPAPPYAASV